MPFRPAVTEVGLGDMKARSQESFHVGDRDITIVASPRLHMSRKLRLRAEQDLEPWHSDMGLGCPIPGACSSQSKGQMRCPSSMWSTPHLTYRSPCEVLLLGWHVASGALSPHLSNEEVTCVKCLESCLVLVSPQYTATISATNNARLHSWHVCVPSIWASPQRK